MKGFILILLKIFYMATTINWCLGAKIPLLVYLFTSSLLMINIFSLWNYLNIKLIIHFFFFSVFYFPGWEVYFLCILNTLSPVPLFSFNIIISVLPGLVFVLTVLYVMVNYEREKRNQESQLRIQSTWLKTYFLREKKSNKMPLQDSVLKCLN